MTLRKFERTDGAVEWIDDRHVVKVFGDANNVKITTVLCAGGPFKGTARDIALTLNGYFDEG